MCGASALAAYCGMIEGRVQQQTLYYWILGVVRLLLDHVNG